MPGNAVSNISSFNWTIYTSTHDLTVLRLSPIVHVEHTCTNRITDRDYWTPQLTETIRPMFIFHFDLKNHRRFFPLRNKIRKQVNIILLQQPTLWADIGFFVRSVMRWLVEYTCCVWRLSESACAPWALNNNKKLANVVSVHRRNHIFRAFLPLFNFHRVSSKLCVWERRECSMGERTVRND